VGIDLLPLQVILLQNPRFAVLTIDLSRTRISVYSVGFGYKTKGLLRSNPESNKLLGMKRYNYHICGLLIVALVCFIFSGCQTSSTGASGSTASMAAPSKNAGRLTIQRAANFGTDLSLNVSIDGAQVAGLSEGRSYNGTLSAGQHMLTLTVDPNRGGIPPTTKRLTVQKGQTYSFTAMWSGERLVLR